MICPGPIRLCPAKKNDQKGVRATAGKLYIFLIWVFCRRPQGRVLTDMYYCNVLPDGQSIGSMLGSATSDEVGVVSVGQATDSDTVVSEPDSDTAIIKFSPRPRGLRKICGKCAFNAMTQSAASMMAMTGLHCADDVPGPLGELLQWAATSSLRLSRPLLTG